MLIDTSYFQKGALFIPAAITQPSIGSNTPTAASELQAAIDQREYEVLVGALGYAQYQELVSNLELLSGNTSYTVKPTAPQKWKDLVNGVTYDGKRWQGLVFTIGTKKLSLLANYTFFFYLKEDYANYTTTGVQVSEAENSTRQAPNQFQTNAWAGFIGMYGGSCERRLNYSLFHNHNGMGITWALGTNNQNIVTLHRYLTDHSDDFDTSFFTHHGLVNPYNL